MTGTSERELGAEFAPEQVSWRPKGGEAVWLTLETVVWGFILGHIVHWASDAGYYIGTQTTLFTEAKHGQPVAVYGSYQPGDWWDRLPVHLANLLHWNFFGFVNNGQAAPLWWVTDRHDIRYVYIGVATGVVVAFLTSRPPKVRKDYTWYRIAATPLLAFAAALPGIAVGALAIWKIPALQTGGINPPASWGMLGHEIGQWSGSGKLALVVLGLLGSQLFAKYASKGPADEIQWLYAARKANMILRERTGALSALGNLKDSIVIGPPGYRRRVRYLVDNGIVTEVHSTGIVVVLALGAFLVFILAGYGAWLTLAGPAAGV